MIDSVIDEMEQQINQLRSIAAYNKETAMNLVQENKFDDAIKCLKRCDDASVQVVWIFNLMNTAKEIKESIEGQLRKGNI